MTYPLCMDPYADAITEMAALAKKVGLGFEGEAGMFRLTTEDKAVTYVETPCLITIHQFLYNASRLVMQ